jgi:hypothetical protein
MEFRKAFGQTINSFIRNFAPWGIYASLASAFVAYQLISRIWPDLSSAMAAVWMIPVTVAIYLAGFLALATAVAIRNATNTHSD